MWQSPPLGNWARYLSTLLICSTLFQACCPVEAASNHSSNWAVLVSTSRYWLNYRHSANIFSVYRAIKQLGFPDSHIVMMVADDHACNPRNPYKGALFSNESHVQNVYGHEVEVDYRGYEVTVDNFLRVLTGRHDPGVPRSKRLLSDAGSNVMIYMTGHGGDEFIKFQDTSELMAQDLADAMAQMADKQRYNQVLLMIESCQAATMLNRMQAPRIIGLASSIKGESSFSYKNDFTLGQPVTDRFTYLTLQFVSSMRMNSSATLQDMISIYTYTMMESHLGYHVSNGWRPLSDIKVIDFLGSAIAATGLQEAYPLRRAKRNKYSSTLIPQSTPRL